MRQERIFEGWSEGNLDFPPTYKYELDSEIYRGKDPKSGKRTPAWYAALTYSLHRPFKYGMYILKLNVCSGVIALYGMGKE